MLKPIRTIWLAAALTFLVPATGNASLITLTNLFVFGDSLSDGGNLPVIPVFPPPPYAGGRFSNGPVAVEYLWQAFNPGNPGGFTPSNSGGTNFALGGATTGHLNFNSINPQIPAILQPVYGAAGGMLDQIAQFSAGCNACFDPATSLFVLWGFPNDLFFSPSLGIDPPTAIAMAVQNITAGIAVLAAEGANLFLVPNTADIGAAPEFRNTPLAPQLTALTVSFNTALAAALGPLDQALGVEIVEFSVFDLFADVIAHPAAYGFSNVTDSCVANLGNPVNPCDPSTWLFWDAEHPTTAAHRIVGEAFADAVPEPAMLALFGLGLAGLVFIRRRRFSA